MTTQNHVSQSIFKKSPFSAINSADHVSVHDITVVITLRAHEANPWVVERLALLGSYYDPKPHVLVLDFGSEPEYAEKVKGLCNSLGFEYHFEDDVDIYSPAAAHNRGFEKSTTDLVLFCDVDCFGERDFFSHLARVATSLKMKSVIDISLILPVYHIGEADSDAITSSGDPAAFSANLSAFGHYAIYAQSKREDNFFIAPYSNIFLVNRHFFNMTGGYDENFRGHGSEDFEYLTRMGIHTGLVPTPKSLTEDRFGPLKAEFSSVKPYIGFRRLLEVMAYPAESFGLKIFHIWHPRPEAVAWLAGNDWKRERMAVSFSKYVSDHSKLLGVDFIKREKRMLCCCKHTDQWGYFLPFRAAGYELIPLFSGSQEEVNKAIAMIGAGEIDAVSIFNPHMKSHAPFKYLIMAARDQGVEVAVIERGALPQTIYYADEVSYTSPQFSEEEYLAADFSLDELSRAEAYVAELRQGNSTLEAMNSYEQTAEKHPALSLLTRTVVFIPLQLEEDMAVTMFIKGEQTYPEFVASLPGVVKDNPDVLFIIKPHPLSNADLPFSEENVMLASREDNVHFLIDAASGVLCYNSGVGLLSILHAKPTVTLGNAFYNMNGAGYHAASLADGIERLKAGDVSAPDPDEIIRLAAWFTERKYSTFIAKDNIRDFGHRKSHGYKDVAVTSFRWLDLSLKMNRQRESVDFSWRSYISARNGMRHQITEQPSPPKPTATPPTLTRQTSTTGLNRLPEKLPSPVDTLLEQARRAYHKSQFKEAARLFTSIAETDTTNAEVHRSAAEAHDRAGDIKKAREHIAIARTLLDGNKNLKQRATHLQKPIFLRLLTKPNRFEVPLPRNQN